MSEHGEGPPPLRRPETARPREGAGAEEPGPPSATELAAIESQLIGLSTISGASVVDDLAVCASIVRLPGAGPGHNYAGRVRWLPSDVPAQIGRLDATLRSAGEWPALVIAEGLTEPVDLPRRLAAAGWVELAAERVMYSRRPPVVPHLDPSLRVEAVTRASAGVSTRLEADVFGLSVDDAERRAAQLAEAVESARLRAFLVRSRGVVVATARLVTGDGVAGIYAVGVARDHRRQGYGGLVTAIATRAGLATGNSLVWLSVEEGNDPAFSLYRGLGYELSFRWSRWAAPPPGRSSDRR